MHIYRKIHTKSGAVKTLTLRDDGHSTVGTGGDAGGIVKICVIFTGQAGSGIGCTGSAVSITRFADVGS